MSNFHSVFSLHVREGSNDEIKSRWKHVLTNTQQWSYHFSHLGVNAFVATCQTPTCFLLSTRVPESLPHSTGSVDKRAIIVLLFSCTSCQLFFIFYFLEDLASVPLFGDKWPTTGSKWGQQRPIDSTIFSSRRGVNWAIRTGNQAQILHSCFGLKIYI